VINLKKKIVKKVAKKTEKKTSKKATKSASKAKSAAKKTSKPKKSTSVDISKKVSGDKVFFVIDGTTISSLKELVDSFGMMSDDVFYYHVTADRNDFANWVRDILKLEDLADKLLNVQGPIRAQVEVFKYLLKW